MSIYVIMIRYTAFSRIANAVCHMSVVYERNNRKRTETEEETKQTT